MPFYRRPQEPLAHVIIFLDTAIRGYVVGDLKRLAEIRPDPQPPNLRGCTVPESLAVFAVLDLMGFLMRKDFDDEKELDMDRLIQDQVTCTKPGPKDAVILKRIDEKARKTSDNVEYILANWLTCESNDYDELARELIIKLFRHGGAHQFLPKAAGIAKWGKERPLVEFRKAEDGFPLPILNEDRFREDSLATLGRIVRILENEDEEELRTVCGDSIEELATRMSNRLTIRHWLDRDMLKKILRSKKPDLLRGQGSQTELI